MESGLSRKIQKANQYAEERERFSFHDFAVSFHGTQHEHEVSYHRGDWKCDCDYFLGHGYCAHSLALERLLAGMISPVGPAEPT